MISEENLIMSNLKIEKLLQKYKKNNSKNNNNQACDSTKNIHNINNNSQNSLKNQHKDVYDFLKDLNMEIYFENFIK